jgi:hypothetical protein
MLSVCDPLEEMLLRFLVGTGFCIGEAAVAQWRDIDWKEKNISMGFKPEFGFRPKDYEQRIVEVSDVLLAFLRRRRGKGCDEALIFPSPERNTVDKHFSGSGPLRTAGRKELEPIPMDSEGGLFMIEIAANASAGSRHVKQRLEGRCTGCHWVPPGLSFARMASTVTSSPNAPKKYPVN